MLETFQNFSAEFANQPTWVVIWVNWFVLINTASVFFVFARAETRWVLVAWVAAVAGVMGLYSIFGMERILGLGHIIPWTPLLWYLWRRRGDIFLTHASGIYLHILFFTNAISLAFDYVDLVRYFLGHGY